MVSIFWKIVMALSALLVVCAVAFSKFLNYIFPQTTSTIAKISVNSASIKDERVSVGNFIPSFKVATSIDLNLRYTIGSYQDVTNLQASYIVGISVDASKDSGLILNKGSLPISPSSTQSFSAKYSSADLTQILKQYTYLYVEINLTALTGIDGSLLLELDPVSNV